MCGFCGSRVRLDAHLGSGWRCADNSDSVCGVCCLGRFAKRTPRDVFFGLGVQGRPSSCDHSLPCRCLFYSTELMDDVDVIRPIVIVSAQDDPSLAPSLLTLLRSVSISSRNFLIIRPCYVILWPTSAVRPRPIQHTCREVTTPPRDLEISLF